jgi:CheY-like chemotaxis protein
MARLLHGTCDLVQRSLNIEVVLEVEPFLEAENGGRTACVDANQLQQVLVNLSLNARDAMPQPQPAPVVYRLRRLLLQGELPAFPQNVPAGDYLLIEVQDRGTGMAPEVMAQALDPFFTTKEVGQGTGLGLPVAFGIMNGHHGYLSIDSRVGVGTCIGLYLPRLLHKGPDPTADNVTVLEPEVSVPKRILVVDDEEAVLDVVRRFLEIAGHEVVCAATGRQALTHLQESSIDMIILDWMIPREEGRANFQLIRQMHPRLPILLCTGLVQADQAMALAQEGGAMLLRKPFRMNELWYVVNNVLSSTPPAVP